MLLFNILGCDPEEVNVYVKRGSIPVLNPDNSKFPEKVRNITKSELHELHLVTNKEYSFINITTPEPGIYYFVSFFPYIDPDQVAVKPTGLSKHCTGFINIISYISIAHQITLLTNNYSYQIFSKTDKHSYYEFYMSPSIKEVHLNVGNINNSDVSTNITVRLGCESLPSINKYIYSKTINVLDKNIIIPFWLNIPGRYYLQFEFIEKQGSETSVQFSLDSLTINETLHRKNINSFARSKIDPVVYKTAVIDFYEDKFSKIVEPYLSYNLIKESSSESFLYTYNINHENEKEFMVPIPLNLTSDYFSVLKFQLQDVIDVGGTFQLSMDFHPTKNQEGHIELYSETIDHIIIGCISQNVYQIPTLPQHCSDNGIETIAPVVINNTVNNSTVFIPYPESGMWYVSIKLFCKPCYNCPCYKKCNDILETCTKNCKCESIYTCRKCLIDCKSEVARTASCANCNCVNCETSKKSCNSTIMFDLSSLLCVKGTCGANGRCQLNLADGYIISACRCRNKYRGIACNDDSKATPFWKIIVAQVLLISSNLIMLPCVYVAIRRKYYPEAIMYSFVLLFSSFYHACDVGDYSIQFCLTTHASLQFGDFFSALLSIWGTMLAISDLDVRYRSTLYVLAAILVSYCTVIDKRGVWIFLLVTIPGLLIIIISWYLKYRKSGKQFIKKTYLKYYFSSGSIVMLIGIIIFGYFQTNGNYMYLHSLWHCIAGIAVLAILPRKDTFSPMENL
ncbi:hypothetical protein WA026_018664 [Henosepilachna vigintioctopunctata]|uniref:EGF-like domain-containing protein n=1 Tax=Henosepilachna vigintioctopunctata TaxID=420089 RepID=A0AAW1UE69_9CUCU